MIKRLVIIPARSGSKRIKNKNIKKILGKPLIEYSLNACINSKIFKKIFVSTDSKEILKIVEKKNIKIKNLRPKKLSGDNVPLMSVIRYVVESFKKKGEEFDEIWLVYATNPLISSLIIKKCANKFKSINNNKIKNKALMTVTEYNYPVQWAQKINKIGVIKPLFKKINDKSSQLLTKYYCDAGMIGIYSREALINIKKINYIPFIINKYKSVDIDNIDDFNFAVNLKKNG